MHALFGLLAASALSYVPYRTDGGVLLHWPPGATPPIVVSAGVPQGLSDATCRTLVEDAFGTWLATACEADVALEDQRPPLSVPTLGDAQLDDDDGTIAVVWMTDVTAWNARFGSKELARTILMHKHVSGEIVDADIAVNFGGFLFATAASCTTDRYDFVSMVTHEAGHVLGLDHSLVPTATMAPRSEVGECDKRALDADDIAGFCATYTRPVPVTPEPGPEPVPEVVEAAAAEPEAKRGTSDDGCNGGASSAALGMLIAALGLLGARRREAFSGYRASDGCRRGRPPSPARS